MLKIAKIKDKENITVSAQKACACAGQVLKYPPKYSGCLTDCDEYFEERWYQAQCQ
ncbi:hypothetical protein [Paraclostridium bifermentans]|uniref:hypothetical protein n=1 Tax=Paraclostridium bifermentans TaxID=1490 RepID=UPI0018AB2876|nr:hypothetical protein [Paraclostridium bifermentans]